MARHFSQFFIVCLFSQPKRIVIEEGRMLEFNFITIKMCTERPVVLKSSPQVCISKMVLAAKLLHNELGDFLKKNVLALSGNSLPQI
jgi:hypothetical protein